MIASAQGVMNAPGGHTVLHGRVFGGRVVHAALAVGASETPAIGRHGSLARPGQATPTRTVWPWSWLLPRRSS